MHVRFNCKRMSFCLRKISWIQYGFMFPVVHLYNICFMTMCLNIGNRKKIAVGRIDMQNGRSGSGLQYLGFYEFVWSTWANSDYKYNITLVKIVIVKILFIYFRDVSGPIFWRCQALAPLNLARGHYLWHH